MENNSSAQSESRGGGGYGSSSSFWLPYCGRGHQKSVNDMSSDLPGHKLLRDLNREVSAYHNMALALGGSSDCEQLRGELKRTRRKAQELASLNQAKLRSIHSDENRITNEERCEIDRLWCLLYCCLYVLELEMQRTLQLQKTFTLHVVPMGFINTGLNEYDVGHKGGITAMDVNGDVPLVDRLSLERAEISQLQKEIQELEAALEELKSAVDMCSDFQEELFDQLSKMNSPSNTGLARLLNAKIGNSNSYSADVSLQIGGSDFSSVIDESGITSEHRPCLCAVMFVVVSIFVMAAILGLGLGFFSITS